MVMWNAIIQCCESPGSPGDYGDDLCYVIEFTALLHFPMYRPEDVDLNVQEGKVLLDQGGMHVSGML